MMNTGLPHTLIDTVGFYAGNSLLHSSADKFPKPSVDKIIVFAGADLLVRNGYISYGSESIPLSGVWNKNAYISLISLIGGLGIDLLQKKDMSNSLMKNVYLNAVGFLTNSVIDKVIPEKYI